MVIRLEYTRITRRDVGKAVSAEIINLNQFRKTKAKAEKQATASENRRKHGRTKAEKKSDKKLKQDAGKALDGKKFDDGQRTPE